MLNQAILVARIEKIDNDILLIKTSDNDIITTKLISDTLKNNLLEYCKIGDLVGIKGKLVKNNNIIVEKITFLSSKKSDE